MSLDTQPWEAATLVYHCSGCHLVGLCPTAGTPAVFSEHSPHASSVHVSTIHCRCSHTSLHVTEGPTKCVPRHTVLRGSNANQPLQWPPHGRSLPHSWYTSSAPEHSPHSSSVHVSTTHLKCYHTSLQVTEGPTKCLPRHTALRGSNANQPLQWLPHGRSLPHSWYTSSASEHSPHSSSVHVSTTHRRCYHTGLHVTDGPTKRCP